MAGSKKQNRLEKKTGKAEAALQKKLAKAGASCAPPTNAESSDRSAPVQE